MIAHEIAALRGISELSPESLYLVGLFHDLGRFVMFDESPAELCAVDEMGWRTPDELVEAERQICGFDHAELGWYACRLWGVPESIATVVRYHHAFDPMGCAPDVPFETQAIAMVQMADVIALLCHHQKDVLALDEADLVDLIAEGGEYQRWDPPPVPAEMLAPRLHTMLVEANGLAADLGVGLTETDPGE